MPARDGTIMLPVFFMRYLTYKEFWAKLDARVYGIADTRIKDVYWPFATQLSEPLKRRQE